MEKILLAFDSEPADEGAIDFACHLAVLTQSRLTGVFPGENTAEEQIVVEQQTAVAAGTSITITGIETLVSPLERQEENITAFHESVARANIPAAIYLGKGDAAAELIAQSRYADLLVIGADSFSGAGGELPTEFVKGILHDSACPVIISPDDFQGIDNIAFCYDGSKASLFAIKQFAYLFPQLRSQRVKVIGLRAAEVPAEDQARLTEWLGYHFSNVEWVAQGDETAEALFHYLLKRRQDFVVMGPYGHGLLTSFFEPEYETGTLRMSSLPIFVSHG
ncbi:MAG TPA: universal stress protein [Puia sp.]|nr:universal stress protein [Puia sp.]